MLPIQLQIGDMLEKQTVLSTNFTKLDTTVGIQKRRNILLLLRRLEASWSPLTRRRRTRWTVWRSCNRSVLMSWRSFTRWTSSSFSSSFFPTTSGPPRRQTIKALNWKIENIQIHQSDWELYKAYTYNSMPYICTKTYQSSCFGNSNTSLYSDQRSGHKHFWW